MRDKSILIRPKILIAAIIAVLLMTMEAVTILADEVSDPDQTHAFSIEGEEINYQGRCARIIRYVLQMDEAKLDEFLTNLQSEGKIDAEQAVKIKQRWEGIQSRVS